MQYRIHYHVYRIYGENAAEAKKNAVELLRQNGDKLITVELDHERPPLWRLFLFGH